MNKSRVYTGEFIIVFMNNYSIFKIIQIQKVKEPLIRKVRFRPPPAPEAEAGKIFHRLISWNVVKLIAGKEQPKAFLQGCSLFTQAERRGRTA